MKRFTLTVLVVLSLATAAEACCLGRLLPGRRGRAARAEARAHAHFGACSTCR